jgi:hypothetical protein
MYKVFSVCCIFTGCHLVMASNIVASLAFKFTSLLASHCLTIQSLLQLINSQAGSHLTSTSYSSHGSLKTRLSCNHSCSSVYSLGTDHIENTSPNSSPVVASHSYRTNCVQNIASQLLHCCMLRICCGRYIIPAVVT